MIIIQDTREKKPWNFSVFKECGGQIVQKVDAGDYTIQGYDDLITIDRKRSAAEIANNLGANIVRFENELERMQVFKHRYIICEFSLIILSMFPKGAKLPRAVKRKIRIRGPFLIKQITRLTDEFDVEFIFCKNRLDAQATAMKLFQEALNEN